MKFRYAFAAALFAMSATLATATLAQTADGVYFHYSDGTNTAEGNITTAFPLIGQNVITNITGTWNGQTITGLLPAGTMFGLDGQPDGIPTDNVFYYPAISTAFGPAYFSLGGIGFAAGQTKINLFADNETYIASGGGLLSATVGGVGNLNVSPTCSSILQNAVTVQVIDGADWPLNPYPTSIFANFTPQGVSSIAEAAQDCSINGYKLSGFNWEQTILEKPQPNPVTANSDPGTPLVAPYADPPPSGDAYCTAEHPCNGYPYYYDTQSSGCTTCLDQHMSADGLTLSFFDAPSDPCYPASAYDTALRALYGETDQYNYAFYTSCGGQYAPEGSETVFLTELVGVSATTGLPVTLADLGLDPDMDSFYWTDNFNGTTGGIAQDTGIFPVDIGSGTGGVTLLSVNGVPVAPVPEAWTLALFGAGLVGAATMRRRKSKA